MPPVVNQTITKPSNDYSPPIHGPWMVVSHQRKPPSGSKSQPQKFLDPPIQNAPSQEKQVWKQKDYAKSPTKSPNQISNSFSLLENSPSDDNQGPTRATPQNFVPTPPSAPQPLKSAPTLMHTNCNHIPLTS